MPQQLPVQAETLERLGLELDPRDLADPSKAPLGAVVSLGGCSASFVSPDGLIVTNHHCVQGALAYNSSPAENLIDDGALAHRRADEKWAGPTVHAYVATKYTDVTATMTAGLAALPDDSARHAALEEREKKLLAECEAGRPELRCKVSGFFGDGQWYLIESLDIRDVRLVYAPPASVGNYGGETDNWMWPRHAGDFSFLRAYVGKDGKPADHSDDNVPYRPAHHLKVATAPLREGDLVLVPGYPGTTKRLSTAGQTADAAEWYFPRNVAALEQQLKVLNQVTAGKPELRIKAEPQKRGVQNYLKKNGGVLDTLTRGGLLARRQQEDAELLSWIDADPARAARYRPALARIDALDAEKRKTREADEAWKDILAQSKLLAQAVTIVRMASERQLPDAERSLEYQQRNWSRIDQASRALRRSYARELDRAVMKLYLMRALALPPADRPPGLAKIVGTNADEARVDAALDRLYTATKLENVDVRLGLLRNATPEMVKSSADPFIRLAASILPEVLAHEAKNDAYKGGMALVGPLYVEARTAWKQKPVAPDANGTLRVTFGRVLPSPKGGRAFTTPSELVAKNTGEEPFKAPADLVAAIQAGKWGPYAAEELGEVPVDFMSDVDITNGNSGSATLNARGELVGLAFDGVLDTIASDWSYLEDVTRTIHVDLRYVLWTMDAVDGADELLKEMGVKPAL